MPEETEEEKKRRKDQLEALKKNQTPVSTAERGRDVYQQGGDVVVRPTVKLRPKAEEVVEENPIAKAAREAKKRRDQAAAVAPKK